MARKQRTQPGPYLMHMELIRNRIADETAFPYCLPVVRNLDRLSFHPKVTFFVGENGSGKSTLLEGLAVASGLNAEGGSPNFQFSTRASHSPLDQNLRIVRTLAAPKHTYFLRAESFYNLASEVERLGVGGYGDRPLHEQSHGESFFSLFENRFGEHGLYLLDEPEAALSPKRQMQFLVILHRLVQQGSQFVIATHSPIIMAYPQARIYRLDGEGIRPVEYAETEHFLITRGFLANPSRSLDLLFRDEAES